MILGDLTPEGIVYTILECYTGHVIEKSTFFRIQVENSNLGIRKLNNVQDILVSCIISSTLTISSPILS